MMTPDFVIFFDGGGTGNPGDLAVAAVVCSQDYEPVIESARPAGYGTTNVAEYRALSYAISLANLAGARNPMFISDSMLVVQQINGAWARKGDTTSPLVLAHSDCSSDLMRFDSWSLKHVRREKNKRADWLVSKFLGHSRTTKNKPEISRVETDGRRNPGWSRLESSRKAKT